MNEFQKATFGNGCFWCTEVIFQQLRGVVTTKSGYSGGHVEHPTYQAVCAETTGHAEVLQIEFDPAILSFVELLEVFWKTHDPTTLHRQGNDIGTQYRSVIFYHNKQQKLAAEDGRVAVSMLWSDPIVTEIMPLKAFYPAEDYHDSYFDLHGHEPYCSLVIAPKVAQFRKKFGDKVAK